MSAGAEPLARVTTLGAGGEGGLPATFLWLGVLLVVTVGGYVAIMWFRRRLLAEDGSQGAESFMQELRRMRDAGQISVEEYDRTRKKMATRIAAGTRSTAPGTSESEVRRGRRQGSGGGSPDNRTSEEQT